MAQTDADVEIPGGYSRVNPWVISLDTDAEIEFVGAVFGGRERDGSRVLNPDGTIGHVEVSIWLQESLAAELRH